MISMNPPHEKPDRDPHEDTTSPSTDTVEQGLRASPLTGIGDDVPVENERDPLNDTNLPPAKIDDEELNATCSTGTGDDVSVENDLETNAIGQAEDTDTEPSFADAVKQEDPIASRDALTATVKDIQGQIAALADDFRGKMKYDAHKNSVIDQLHAELQTYRNDLLRGLLRPVLMDIILLADDQRKLMASYCEKAPDELDPQKLLKLMADVPEALDEILYRQGIDTCKQSSEQFDPKTQKALKRIETDAPEKNRTVATRLRPGYVWDDQVLRPELVSVYVYREKPAPEPPEAPVEKE